MLFYVLAQTTSLTAVLCENQCMSLGAYEWPVLVFTGEWFRESQSKLRNGSPNYIHLPLDVAQN